MTSETKNKSLNPTTKMMLKGHVQKRLVRCGKANCRCASGAKHTAFYRVWFDHGQRHQAYVRKSDVEEITQSCAIHRSHAKQLREGRKGFKEVLAIARMILKEMKANV